MSVKNYLIGIIWFILHLFCSATNDIISKYLGSNLHSFQITCLRFTFSAIGLLPFIIYYGPSSLKTDNIFIHCIRAILLFLGITAWTYGISISHVSLATVISFTIPIFTLIIAALFLEEKILYQRWITTMIGFIGVIVTLQPHANDFNPQTMIFIIAAIIFASLDIVNKRFVIQEPMLCMLFYSSIITAIISAPAAILYWTTPTLTQWLLLFFMGSLSANLILFCILKAFALLDATAVAPYRYLELIISSIISYLVFTTLPPDSVWQGAIIIIPTTLYIVYSENKTSKSSVL